MRWVQSMLEEFEFVSILKQFFARYLISIHHGVVVVIYRRAFHWQCENVYHFWQLLDRENAFWKQFWRNDCVYAPKIQNYPLIFLYYIGEESSQVKWFMILLLLSIHWVRFFLKTINRTCLWDNIFTRLFLNFQKIIHLIKQCLYCTNLYLYVIHWLFLWFLADLILSHHVELSIHPGVSAHSMTHRVIRCYLHRTCISISNRLHHGYDQIATSSRVVWKKLRICWNGIICTMNSDWVLLCNWFERWVLVPW